MRDVLRASVLLCAALAQTAAASANGAEMHARDNHADSEVVMGLPQETLPHPVALVERAADSVRLAAHREEPHSSALVYTLLAVGFITAAAIVFAAGFFVGRTTRPFVPLNAEAGFGAGPLRPTAASAAHAAPQRSASSYAQSGTARAAAPPLHAPTSSASAAAHARSGAWHPGNEAARFKARALHARQGRWTPH